MPLLLFLEHSIINDQGVSSSLQTLTFRKDRFRLIPWRHAMRFWENIVPRVFSALSFKTADGGFSHFCQVFAFRIASTHTIIVFNL